MRRSLILALTFVLFVLVSIGTAFAADPDEVADEVDPRGYYIEPGAGVDFEAMEDLVDDVASGQTRFYFVALAEDPSEGADEFAENVLQELPQRSTVVVLSPGEIGARSDTFGDDELDRAAQEAVGDSDASYEGDFRVFAESLVGVPVGTTATTVGGTAGGGDAGGGGGGVWVFLLIVAAVIALVVFMTRRGAKRDQALSAKRIEEAKTEIRGQLDVIANEILDLSDRVSLSERDEAEEYFRTASATYQDAQGQLEEAATLAELERLSDQLDRTRWQLEAAEAVVEGRPVPPEPEDRPNSCFFDPTHRAGVEEAKIKTAAGEKMVSVCRECADKLRRGEQPKPREIVVGGRRVPAPMAPRSYGGGGFDWMSAVAIILSGLGRGADFDFGRRPRRAPRLGGPIFPTRGIPRRSSSRSTPRPSRSRSRGMGRTRRKR